MPLWKQKRILNLCKRQNYKCHYCNKVCFIRKVRADNTATVEHLFPIGDIRRLIDPERIVMACQKCNSDKNTEFQKAANQPKVKKISLIHLLSKQQKRRTMQIELTINLTPTAEGVLNRIAVALESLSQNGILFQMPTDTTSKGGKKASTKAELKPVVNTEETTPDPAIDALDKAMSNAANTTSALAELTPTEVPGVTVDQVKELIKNATSLEWLNKIAQSNATLIAANPELVQIGNARAAELQSASSVDPDAGLKSIINGAMDKGHLQSIYTTNQVRIDATPALGELLQAKAQSFAPVNIFGDIPSAEEKTITIEAIRAAYVDPKFNLHNNVDVMGKILGKLQEMKVPNGPDNQPTIAMLAKMDNSARVEFYNFLIGLQSK